MEKFSDCPSAPTHAELRALGALVAARRKALRVSTTVVAQAAGVSRVTLHRIEKGQPSVAIGLWAQVTAALGLHWSLTTATANANTARSGWLPTRIALSDYPQLQDVFPIGDAHV